MKRTAARDIIESIAIAVVLALLIRFFLFEPFFIPTASMKPTLLPGDRVLVNKFIYRFTAPDYGDIIVFKSPLDEQDNFIKRVVGVGGEEVKIKNNKIWINEKPLEEPYILSNKKNNDLEPLYIPEGNYFVLGDYRTISQDSRHWGLVSEDDIVGKAVIIFLPLSRLQLIN